MNAVHSEKDLMGTIDVPADKLWDAQTQRSPEHFRIPTEKTPTSLIHTLTLTKRAAAKVNENLGLLSEERASAIRQAADEVLVGQHDDKFPLAIWQTDSGMRSNMNMNEVLTNQASELLDGVYGMKRRIRPNGDVNKSQSSSGVLPMVMYVAVLLALRKQLAPQLKTLTQALNEKSRASTDVVKTGRTHLQDATPLMLGQEVSGWVAMLEHNLEHIECSLSHVAELAPDGTAMSTGLDTRPGYARRIADGLAVTTCASFVATPNKFRTLTTYDTLVQARGTLRGLAASLMRIANDVRWLAPNPRCGVGEVSIPENESGGSIMPGEVNPIQCEVLIMFYCQVMRSGMAVNIGGAFGGFELNVFRPVVTRNFLQSVCSLAGGMESFNEHCAVGIEPSRERVNQLFNELLTLVTALNTHTGYNRTAEIVKKVHKERLTSKTTALALGHLSGIEFDNWIQPEQMVGSMKAGH